MGTLFPPHWAFSLTPYFSAFFSFGNVSSFLLNSLKLLTSMTDMGNTFHMLSFPLVHELFPSVSDGGTCQAPPVAT